MIVTCPTRLTICALFDNFPPPVDLINEVKCVDTDISFFLQFFLFWCFFLDVMGRHLSGKRRMWKGEKYMPRNKQMADGRKEGGRRS